MRANATPSPGRRNETVVAWLVSIGLVAAVSLLYAQSRHFEFLTLDDLFVLVQRPIVSRGLSWDGMRWAITTLDPDWYPITWLSHMLCFSLFGADAGGHHLVNAGLHAANAVLLFLALRALSGALWPSALVAALFALHPMRAESVAWVTERKDTMSGLWWMLTLLAYAWYARRPDWLRYAAVVLTVACGLMSKPMLVSLPLVLLLLDLWPLGRLQLPTAASAGAARARAPAAAHRSPPASVGRLVLEKIPLLALALAVSLMTVVTLSGTGGVRSMDQVSLGWRLVNPPIGYATYLWQTIWPSRLAVMYPHPAYIAGVQLAPYVWAAIGAAVLLAAITALCIATVRTRPYLIVGWLWYLGTLVPVIGLLAVGRQWHADRFTYLPLIGIYIMVAWALRDVVAARPRLRTPVVAAAAAALLALAVSSWRQIGVWQDSRTLFEHAVAVTENNYFAHQTLGAALSASGDLEPARRHLEEALRISPDSAYAAEQLGLLLERQGDRAGAAAAYERAVALSWKSFYARRNLAAIRRAEGQVDAAIALWTAALEYQPADPQLRFDLGTALLQQDRYADATVQLQRAVELAPNFVQAHNNLGVALAKQGRYAEAASQFERTLALQPTHASAAQSLQWVRGQLAAQP